uniref:Ribonucleotide reductase large subunit C-terminal domain-containing protein n=1 Tax=Populus trichocarpa TaxID=3694 RepID=B9GT86_POPTR
MQAKPIFPTGSSIRGEDGASNGFVPTLRVFNHTDRYLIKEEGRGKEERRAQDLFCALWIPDLFIERVRGDGSWKGQKKVVSARKLWFEILNSQTETGTPYMLFHDTVVTDLQLQVGKNRAMCWLRPNPS